MTTQHTATPMPTDPLGRAFVYVAIVEAFTWAGLLIGMFLEYIVDVTRIGITVFGPLHGAAFIIFGVLALAAAIRFKWSLKLLLVTWLSAVPPFTTIPMERWLRRNDRFSVPAQSPSAAA